MASRIEISWNDAVLTVYDTTVYNPVPAEGLPITVKYNGGVLFNGIIQPNGNISVSCSTGTDGLPASGIYSVEINGEENVYSISYERPTKVISFLLDGFNSKLTVKDATQYVGITTYEMACQSPNGNTTQSSNPQVVLTPVYSGLYDVGVTVSVHLSGAGYDITDTYTNKSEYRVYRVEKDALFEAVENFLSVFDSSETRRRKVMKLNIFQDEYERAIQQGDNVGAYGYLVKMAIELGMVGEDGLELPVVTVEQSGSHTHTNLDVLSKLSDVSGSLYYNGSSIGEDGRIKLSSPGSYDYISNLIDDSLRVSGDVLGISPSGLLGVLYGIDGASSGIDADMLDGKHASAFALTTHTHDGVYSPVGHTHSYEPLISKQNGYLTYLSGAWVFKNEQYALANHTHTDYYTKSELQTSGASSVHWNNITSKPLAFSPAAHGSTHTSSGGDSIPVFTMGQSGLVPPGVTSDRFLRGDGVWAYITTESGDYLDMVKRMVVDNTYDPSPATTGDRYIVLTTTLHANFGTINKDLSGNTLTLGVNDIVQYNGSEFRIAFDASAAMQSATVMVLYDKWGNENHTWTYNISTDQWVDRGAAGQHNSLSGLNVGDYKHLTQYQLSGLTTGIETTLHKHSIAYITNLQTTLDGKVPTSRTINGKALSANIVLTVSDIGAAASSHTHTPSEVGLGNVTNDAQLKRSGNDWLIFGSKIYSGLGYNDRVLIEDANSSYVKKYTTLSDVKNWISNSIIPSQALSIVYETPDQQWGLNDYFKPLFINGRAYLTTTNQVATLADLAYQLATARTINGTSFDGSANITTSSWGTSRTITIGNTGKSVNGSGNVSWSLSEIGAASTSHTHTPSEVGLGNVTNDAQLKRSGNDWLIFGSKIYSGLDYNDRVLIEDANSSYVKKYTTLSDVKNWISNSIIPSQALSIVYETPDQQWGLNDYFKPLFINGRAYLTTTNQVATLVDLAYQLATARTITIGSTGKSFDGSSNISFTLGEIGAAATSHTHTPSNVGLGNVTNDAQLKRAAGDFNSFTEKTSLASSDVILIEDSAASYAKKKATISSITSSITSVNYANEAGKATEIIPTNYPLPIAPTVTVKYIDNGKVRLYPVDEQGWQDFGFIADEAYSSTFATKLQTPRTLTIGNTGKNFDGSANVSWSLSEIGAAASSHTHSDYTPFASNSQTIPMNTPSGAWYRIAASAVNVYRCDGIFELEFVVSGYHQRVSFRASSMLNSDNSIQIVKMGGSKYNNDNNFVIQSVRVVYYPNTYSGVYAYVEVFVTNPNTSNNATLATRLVDAIGWGLTTGAGSIPTNYAAKELSVKNHNPFYNTNDKRGVITPSSGVLNINLGLANNETVACNITQNTTINISGLYDGAAGTILLYLNGTYNITLGTMTNDAGSSVTKHTSGTFSSLAAGYYIIAYRVLPDASGTWRVFFNISPKYN